MTATIKVLQNGPFLVEGDSKVVNKPFCDGAHTKNGFAAAEAAVSGSQDKSAR